MIAVATEVPVLPRTAPDTIRIIPLGGVEEIGRNMTAVEYMDDIIVVDAGIEFSDEALSEEVTAWLKYWKWLNQSFILSRNEDEGGYISSMSSDPDTAAKVWLKYRRMVGNTVSADWYKAFENAQIVHPARVEMAKEASIPPELLRDADFLSGEGRQESPSGIDVSSM